MEKALCDDPNNGCEEDYVQLGTSKLLCSGENGENAWRLLHVPSMHDIRVC